MTRIEQMIKDMCPNGVEWKTLGEICELVTKQTGFDYSNTIKPALLTKRSEGAIPYMQTRNFSGRNFNYETEYYVPEHIVNQFPRIVLDKKCLLISIVGSIGNVGLFPGEEKCFLGGAICVLKFKPGINISFVYEFMSSIYGQKLLKSKIKGSGQSTITIEDIRKFSIPLPPQEIQERIVIVLEKYAALAAELQAELQKRRTQYEYYRTQLLTPPQTISPEGSTDDRNWEWKTLGEICTILRGKRLTKSELSEDGKYPVFHGGIEPLGYYKEYNREANTVMIINVGASAGTVGFSDAKFWSSDGCYCLSKSDMVIPKFMYYLLQKRESELKSRVRYAGIPTLDSDVIKRMKIALPSLEEQARIVAILDKFEALTTSLSDGIPAEQAAQQKRYEYFRDKLLTFPRKEV